MLITSFNYAQLLVWKPRTQTATYTNSTGGSVTIAAGTLIGRVVATNLILPQVSTATDGSQVPIGVAIIDYTVANGASATITFAVSGDLNSGLIVFGGSDTLATTVSVGGDITGTINDILTGRGLYPVPSTEFTYADNS